MCNINAISLGFYVFRFLDFNRIVVTLLHSFVVKFYFYICYTFPWRLLVSCVTLSSGSTVNFAAE